jgi:GTPase SAR1 family protein
MVATQNVGVSYGKLRLIEKIIGEHWQCKPNEKQYTFNELIFVLNAVIELEGKPYLEGSTFSLQRGFNNFRLFSEHLLYRNLANFDSMVLITGTKGSGKSSAAIMLARQWCKLLGIKFNPNRHIAYNNSDMMTKIDKLNKFEVIIADESVRFAAAADWAKRENKTLKKKLAQVRTKHLLYILCFPFKIYKLESTYLQSFTNYWCDIYSRGNSAIFIRDSNPVSDSWKLKDFLKLGSYNEFTSPEKIKERLSKHPNYWTIMKVPKVPEKLYEKYLKIREANIYDDQNVLANVGKEDIYNAFLILTLRDIMSHDSTYSINRILLHIKNEYETSLNKYVLNACLDDAKQLVQKIKEQAIDVNEFERIQSLTEVQMATDVEDADTEDAEEIDTEQTDVKKEDDGTGSA